MCGDKVRIAKSQTRVVLQKYGIAEEPPFIKMVGLR